MRLHDSLFYYWNGRRSVLLKMQRLGIRNSTAIAIALFRLFEFWIAFLRMAGTKGITPTRSTQFHRYTYDVATAPEAEAPPEVDPTVRVPRPPPRPPTIFLLWGIGGRPNNEIARWKQRPSCAAGA